MDLKELHASIVYLLNNMYLPQDSYRAFIMGNLINQKENPRVTPAGIGYVVLCILYKAMQEV